MHERPRRIMQRENDRNGWCALRCCTCLLIMFLGTIWWGPVTSIDLVVCSLYRGCLCKRVIVRCHAAFAMYMWCSRSCTAVCPCQVRILARVVDKQLHHSFISSCPVNGLFSSPGSHPPPTLAPSYHFSSRHVQPEDAGRQRSCRQCQACWRLH